MYERPEAVGQLKKESSQPSPLETRESNKTPESPTQNIIKRPIDGAQFENTRFMQYSYTYT